MIRPCRCRDLLLRQDARGCGRHMEACSSRVSLPRVSEAAAPSLLRLWDGMKQVVSGIEGGRCGQDEVVIIK